MRNDCVLHVPMIADFKATLRGNKFFRNGNKRDTKMAGKAYLKSLL